MSVPSAQRSRTPALIKWILARPRLSAALAGVAFLALAAAGAFVAKLAIDGANLKAEIATVRADAADQRAAGFDAALKAVSKAQAQADAAAAAAAKDRQQLQAAAADIRRAILNAPPTADAPIAPVLADTLERLRRLPTEGAAPDHPEATSANRAD